jgi:thioredoxin reductase
MNELRNANDRVWDVIIVGGGSAGLSAALVLARARRGVLVVDAGEPRNRFAGHLHGFLSRDGISPLELLQLGRDEVRGYGGEIVAGRAVAARGEAGDFTVRVERVDGTGPAGTGHGGPGHGGTGHSGTGPGGTGPGGTGQSNGAARTTIEFTGRRLLIAAGLRDDLPAIPGLAEQWGRGAVACPYCDGWEARDSRIAVVATSPMSGHQASLLRQWSADVTLVGPAAADLDDDTRRGLEARGVVIRPGGVEQVVSSEGGDLVGLRLSGHDDVLEFDRLFVAPTPVNNDTLLRQLGAHLGDSFAGEWVASDPTGLTSVPGVWVAGNTAFFAALVPLAVAAGVTAATTINADLVAEETRAALHERDAVAPAPVPVPVPSNAQNA